jgi:A/G-specific adenine glycosylase
VISRYFGINTPVDSPSAKKLYLELADSLLDKKKPGLYNQAIMDFGATICKPRNPLCRECIQRKECQAFRHDWVADLPVKEKSIKRKSRWFTYYLVEWKGQVYIRLRNGKDIWPDLYELILKESTDALAQKETGRFQVIKKTIGTPDFRLRSISPLFKQQLTHQTIYGQFISLTIDRSLPGSSYQPVQKKDLRKFPFPKLINSYLEQELIQPL